MALTDGQETLSIEQIADAINRQKLGNQKKKNNLINWGMDNQDAFRQKYGSSIVKPTVLNNTPQVKSENTFPGFDYSISFEKGPESNTPQVPTQTSVTTPYTPSPTEIEKYLFSQGYKRAESAIDPKIASILGFKDFGTANNLHYYKGDYDPSTAKWGADNLYKTETAPGQYNTYNENGSLLGTTYGSVKDAIKAYQKKFVADNPAIVPDAGIQQNYDPEDPRFNNPQYQEQYEKYRVNSMAAGTPEWDRTDPYSGGALEDWEVLGQMLTRGTQIPHINYTSPRYTAQQGLDELITGRNSLYGSTPLIANNKVMGYKFNPIVTTGNEFGYEAPNYIKRSDTHGATRSENSLLRNYERPDLWSAYSKNLGNNELFVDAENADKLPGWTNSGTSQYSHRNNGTAGKVLSAIGTVLSFTPLAPLGLAITTMSQLANGNQLGGILGAIGGGLGMAGVGDKLGGSLGIGSNGGKALLSGGLGTLGSVLTGKNPTSGIMQGLGSYLGGEFGDFTKGGLDSLFGSSAISDIGSKAAGGALSNLIQNKNPIEGAALGGFSGGLGSALSSMTDSGMTPDQQEKNKVAAQGLAKTLGKLALSKQQKRRL